VQVCAVAGTDRDELPVNLAQAQLLRGLLLCCQVLLQLLHSSRRYDTPRNMHGIKGATQWAISLYFCR
jgi:hypothetical protein